MQIAAPPNIVYRLANNRPPELSPTAADRLKLLEQWRAIRAEGAPHMDEFYNFYNGELTMGSLNRALWERTPVEYLAEQRPEEASQPPAVSYAPRTSTSS